jgi:hypothetical protein
VKNTNIVPLGLVRELLAEIEKLRSAVLAGAVRDADEMLGFILKTSMLRMSIEDEPLSVDQDEPAEDTPPKRRRH